MSRWNVPLCLIAWFLAPLAAFAQENASTKVALPVTVLDRKGVAPEDLKPADFRAQLGGRDVPVVAAAPTLVGRRIVLLMDVSGSMEGLPQQPWKQQNAWLAAQVIVRTLGPGRQFAVLTFSDGVQMLSSWQENAEETVAKLQQAAGTKPRGQTALIDAVQEALRLLEPAEFGDAIVAITDGEDSRSKSNAVKVRKVLQLRGVRFFCLLLPENISFFSPLRQAEIGQQAMKSLAEETGGLVVSVDSKKKSTELLAQALRPLLNSVHAVYKLELAVTNPPGKETKWKIEVIGADGRRRKGLHANYPPRFLP
jgi:hypothetical protein